MGSWDRTGLTAVLTAACLTVTGAFYPVQARGAWWCTAFSVTCREVSDGAPQDGGTVELKWKIAEWWRALVDRS